MPLVFTEAAREDRCKMTILYSSAGKLAVQNIIRCPAAEYLQARALPKRDLQPTT